MFARWKHLSLQQHRSHICSDSFRAVRPEAFTRLTTGCCCCSRSPSSPGGTIPNMADSRLVGLQTNLLDQPADQVADHRQPTTLHNRHTHTHTTVSLSPTRPSSTVSSNIPFAAPPAGSYSQTNQLQKVLVRPTNTYKLVGQAGQVAVIWALVADQPIFQIGWSDQPTQTSWLVRLHRQQPRPATRMENI